MTPTPTARARLAPLRAAYLTLVLSLLAVALPAMHATASAVTTIWPTTATPTTASVADRTAHELGVKFRADADGTVSGLRFYKGPGNTGTHLGRLWTATGTQLASATFTGESATGWQTVTFTRPVPVTAGRTYVASYFAPNGGFALDQRFFTGKSAGTSGVTALATGTDGSNGVYRYGGAGFPKSSYADANYWVDVLYTAGATSTTAPAPTSPAPTSPAPTPEPTAPAAAPTTTGTTIWPASATPTTASVANRTAHELGVKFRADADGTVSGLRFYKGPGNTGTHLGRLWTATGTQLASATFTGESATGWQTVTFTRPVPVTAGRTYVASYFAPNGGFALDQRFFTGKSAGTSGVTALATGTDGSNGVYRYGGAGFPKSSYADANYWVDVLYTAGATSTTAPSSPAPTTPAPAPTSPAPTPEPTVAPVAPPPPPTSGTSGSYGPGSDPSRCSGTAVPAGADVQAAISAAPTGATLCLQPGTYRLGAPLSPRSGQTLWGAPGTVLTGSRLMTSWTRSGAAWVSTGHLPAPYVDSGYNPCQDTTTDLCKLNEWAFRDDVPLRRVASAAAVVPGTFYTDYAANRVHVGDDPTGRRMELSRTKTAISSAAQSVTLRGLTVDKFATANQRGAVVVNGSGWKLLHNDIRFNHGAGVYVYAAGATIKGNRVHHNGTLGIAAYKVPSLLVEGNELDHNNTDGSWINDGENGGYKSTNSTDTVVDNYVHDNQGLGLWFDIDNRGSRIEGNRVVDNASDGIRYEISYDGIIRGNTVIGNGHDRRHGDGGLYYGSSIQISTSSNVEVSGNTVSGGDNGIGLAASNRGGGAYGTYVLSGVKVFGNTITMTRGRTGLVQNLGDASYFTSRGNSFTGNSYHLPSTTGTWFAWQGGSRTASQWRGYGNDTTGGFSFTGG